MQQKEFTLRMSRETFELISEGVRMINSMTKATEDQIKQYLLEEAVNDLKNSYVLSKPDSELKAEMTTRKDIVLVLKFSTRDWNEILQGTKARYNFESGWNGDDLEIFLSDLICNYWCYYYISCAEEHAKRINGMMRIADERSKLMSNKN